MICVSGGKPMPDYRLYSLDEFGKISFGEELTANRDEDAIAKASDIKRRTLKCEVWQGRRLVATIDAEDLAD